MRGNHILSQQAKSIENIWWQKINIDWMNEEKLFPPGKICWKKYWEKISIDTVNEEKFFPRVKSIEKNIEKS